eukprot:843983-Pyramimonas_sp.AAC.1
MLQPHHAQCGSTQDFRPFRGSPSVGGRLISRRLCGEASGKGEAASGAHAMATLRKEWGCLREIHAWEEDNVIELGDVKRNMEKGALFA